MKKEEQEQACQLDKLLATYVVPQPYVWN